MEGCGAASGISWGFNLVRWLRPANEISSITRVRSKLTTVTLLFGEELILFAHHRDQIANNPAAPTTLALREAG